MDDMKENKDIILKTLKLISIIILYHIIGSKNIFPYILSLSLYQIFTSCFKHVSIKESLTKLTSIKSKNKLLNTITPPKINLNG